jgi:hypothetical protein
MVDGTDLYGQVFFQTGRFRRVAFLPEASSRACRALVRGGDDLPWFGAVPGPVDAPLVLGSPGLNDASLHCSRHACRHRRLLATRRALAPADGASGGRPLAAPSARLPGRLWRRDHHGDPWRRVTR